MVHKLPDSEHLVSTYRFPFGPPTDSFEQLALIAVRSWQAKEHVKNVLGLDSTVQKIKEALRV